MFSFLLGIISVYAYNFLVVPKPVIVYGDSVLDIIGYEEDMGQQFSTVVGDIRYAWDIEKIWLEVESLEPIEWEIPNSFKEDWYWGQSHPSEHIERCLEADLSYPILIWDGEIIDGTHRTIKALAQNKTTIKAKIITNIPTPDEETNLEPIESNKGISWTHGDMVRITMSIMEYEMMKEYKFRHPIDGM
jgi:hypothetical protein